VSLSVAEVCYFQERFGDDTKHPVNIFKASRLFSPSKLNEIRPIATDIDGLIVFQFLSGEIDHLKEELPIYIAKASDVDSSVDILEWWKSASVELTHWPNAAQKVLSIQPSSAAAERVFSILSRFTNTQMNSLEDYVECTIMLQYNHACH